MVNECVILADDPSALVELCGISTLERLLRTLQRCGIERAMVLSSTPDPIAKELARPSWPREQLNLTLRTRPSGPVRLEQIVDVWPRNSDAIPLLLVIPGGSVFDPRFWWTPAWGHGFRPLLVPRQILPEGNCAAQLFWNTIGLRRKTVFLKKVCATDWSTIVWPRWMSPLSPYTTSRCVANSGHFGFLRHRFRIENWQSALYWIQYKRARQTFPHGFMLRLRPFLFLFSVKRRSHPTS